MHQRLDIHDSDLMSYILSLDAGTTSVRAIVFNHDGQVLSVAQKEIRQIFPKPGWVEHDPQEIWFSQMSVAVEALGRARIRPRDVAGIGITNQRETTIVWDRETGEADLQRHRLAGPPDGAAGAIELRAAGAAKTDPATHRPGAGRLFLRHQA